MKTHLSPFPALILGLVVWGSLSRTVLADDHGGNTAAATAWSTANTAGTIETTADQDWFRFTITVPGYVTIYSGGGTDVSGSLRDSAGDQLTYDLNDGADYNFEIGRVLATGTYYLQVYAGDSSISTGGYTLHIRSPQNAETFNSPNLNSTLTTPGEVRLYRFTTPVAGPYWLQTTGLVDTSGYLLDAGGDQVTYSLTDGPGDNFRISRVLAAGRTFYLLVRAGSSAATTGNFTLQQRHYGNATPIAGSSHSAALSELGELDLYRIAIGRGGLTWLYTTGNTDTSGTLYEIGGDQVTYSLADGPGQNFQIDRVLAAGTYYLLVSGGSSAAVIGDYRLEIRQAATATPLAAGGSLAQSISVPGDLDFFVFQAGAGAAVFSSTGTTNVAAALYDAGGDQLTYDLNGNGAGNFRISRTLAAGTHYLLAYGESKDIVTGAYTLASSFTGGGGGGGAPVSVSATAVTSDGAGRGTVAVTAGGAWTVTGLPSWASASTTSGTGNATLGFTFQPNTTGAERTATVNVGGGLVTLTQPAAAVHLAGPGLGISDAVILTLQTTAGVNYAIESSRDLQSWTATGVTIAGDGTVKTVALPRSDGRGWFRAVVR